jgi:hypothetical protein
MTASQLLGRTWQCRAHSLASLRNSNFVAKQQSGRDDGCRMAFWRVAGNQSQAEA